ncbi:hypothetical protein ACJX0J_012675, partial [Zea mays]
MPLKLKNDVVPGNLFGSKENGGASITTLYLGIWSRVKWDSEIITLGKLVWDFRFGEVHMSETFMFSHMDASCVYMSSGVSLAVVAQNCDPVIQLNISHHAMRSLHTFEEDDKLETVIKKFDDEMQEKGNQFYKKDDEGSTWEYYLTEMHGCLVIEKNCIVSNVFALKISKQTNRLIPMCLNNNWYIWKWQSLKLGANCSYQNDAEVLYLLCHYYRHLYKTQEGSFSHPNGIANTKSVIWLVREILETIFSSSRIYEIRRSIRTTITINY